MWTGTREICKVQWSISQLQINYIPRPAPARSTYNPRSTGCRASYRADLQCTRFRNNMPVLLMMYLDGVVVAVGANGWGRVGNEDLLDAGDGQRGSSPLLPGGPASSGPGAVADGRRGAGSPYTSSTRAQLRRGAGRGRSSGAGCGRRGQRWILIWGPRLRRIELARGFSQNDSCAWAESSKSGRRE
jgi:hypothetical protein